MVCANCEERKATVCCADCKSIGNLLCHVCDRVFHYRQINHTRTLIFRKYIYFFSNYLVCSNCDDEAFTNCVECNQFFCIRCNKVFHYKFPMHNRRDLTMKEVESTIVKKTEEVSHTIHEQSQVVPNEVQQFEEAKVQSMPETKVPVLEITSTEQQNKETPGNETTTPSPNNQAIPIKRPLPSPNKSVPVKPTIRELPKTPTPNNSTNAPVPREIQLSNKEDVSSAQKAPPPTPIPKTVAPNPTTSTNSPVKSTVTAASAR